MASLLEIVLYTVGAVLALGVLSYSLIGDNWTYSIGQAVFLGGVTAHNTMKIVGSVRGHILTAAGGRFLLVIPLVIGALAFARLTKYRWAARYPVALFSGIGLGLAFGLEIQTSVLGVVTQTLDNLARGSPDPISSVILAAMVVVIMAYFLYSSRYSDALNKDARLSWIVRTARILLMVGFGYRYGVVFAGECVGSLADTLTNVIRRTIYLWIS